MSIRINCYLLMLAAVTVSAFVVEVDKTSDRQENDQIKKVVSDRLKRGLAEFGEEMATDDICSPSVDAADSEHRPRRQKMGQLTKIPRCAAGTYAKPFCNRGENQGINYQCVPCPVGYYKSGDGHKGCAQCASHQSTASTGATYCTKLCDKGQYLDSDGEGSTRICLDCPIGEYMPIKNLEPSCIKCPNGKTTTETGSRGKWKCSYPTTASSSSTVPVPTTTAPLQIPDIDCSPQSECRHLNAYCDRYRPEGQPQKCRCPWNQSVTQNRTCTAVSYPEFECYSYTSADRQRDGEREQCEGYEPEGGNRVFIAGLPNYGACSARGCWCCIRNT